MPEKHLLRRPRLVAVWPGMGNVALNAGIYLLAKLEMNLFAELQGGELFDIDHVEVKEGMIEASRRPRHRFFYWPDPKQVHDLIVFLGEAQPPLGKYAFCQQIINHAKEMGVERVFTFAAMATQMHPAHEARVFGAAIDKESLEELKRLELELLSDGHIGGLNGVLLGAAAESGMRGACLLGEMPHIFHQLPFPKASLAILEVFTTITGIQLDFTELSEQARQVEEQLGELLARLERQFAGGQGEEQETYAPPAVEPDRVPTEDLERVERLFEQAAKDRSKAFELKQELDRLGLFKKFEDRFLDLFKKPD